MSRWLRVMRAGAVDFIEKPFAEEGILAAVDRALELGRRTQKAGAEAAEAEARFSQLSAREHQVVQLLVGGTKTEAQSLYGSFAGQLPAAPSQAPPDGWRFALSPRGFRCP